jgi:hypothetical protein
MDSSSSKDGGPSHGIEILVYTRNGNKEKMEAKPKD